MIAQATAADRPVDMVIVYALSRFARRLLTQVTAKHNLTEAGVRLVSLVEDLGDEPNGKMMRSMIAIRNEKYANDASVFTCRNRCGKAANGFWNGGPVPFGYESRVVVTDGRKGRKKLFIREEEAAVVQIIYELAAIGLTGQPMGTRAIAKHLNENGYAFRGRKFFHSNVEGILTREHCAGAYRDPGREGLGCDAIVVPCPQIIDPALIAKVAAIRAKAAPAVTAPRNTNSPVLLGGIATCGHPGCGAGMVIRSGKNGASPILRV